MSCWNLTSVFSEDNLANRVICLQYKLGRGNRDKVQQFMTITGARCGYLIAVGFNFICGASVEFKFICGAPVEFKFICGP